MNIKINGLLLFTIATMGIACQLPSGDDQINSNQFPKLEIYALFGAISQHDWEFVLANSTTRFRDETNASLVIQEKLLNNQKLSTVVKQFVGGDVDSLEGESFKAELVKEIARLISDKDLFFVDALNSLEPSTLDYPFRLPTKITKANFDDTFGSLSIFYKAESESSVDFSGVLWFEKQDKVWKLSVEKEASR